MNRELKLVDEVLREQPEQKALAQKKAVLRGFLVGQVMAKARGLANPALVSKYLEKRLHPIRYWLTLRWLK